MYFKRLIPLSMSVLMACSSAMVTFAYEGPADTVTGRPSARLLSKQTAEEGMVLMKNDKPSGSQNSALPLEDGESIAIFGINQIDFIHGGGGSGDSISEYYVNLYQGMKNKEDAGKLTLYKGLYPAYETYYTNSWRTDISYAYGTRQGAVILKYGELVLSDAQVSDAADAAETAIITIGRTAGESEDRKNQKGDFQLSDKEASLINQVKAQKNAGKFKKIIVILNVTGVMETSWLKDDPAIDAALMVYLPGMEGGNAMADVLCGDAYPSGKLVDTWANSYSDYPSSKNFGNSTYTKYEEDIFVGYRYFETIPGAAEKVNYEFGYGLSYADLSINNTKVDVTGTGRERTVNVTATVKNNSAAYSGKEVVQVYSGVPEDKLTQPKKELTAFTKTKELAPGESETVTMSFPFDDLAGYDDEGKTGADHEAAYVLEAGEYCFYVGNSVREVTSVHNYTLNALEEVQQLAHRLIPNTSNLTRRLKSNGTYENLIQTTAASKTPEDAESKYADPPISANPSLTFHDVIQEVNEKPSLLKDDNFDKLTAFVSRLPDADLVNLVGCVTPQSNRGHRTSIGINKYDIPKIGSSNGPAGVQWNLDRNANPNCDSSQKQALQEGDPNRNSTLFPNATMQASTWNVDLIEQIGAAMGTEAAFFGMSLWQAPGVNIHRDPLCGRNFEYFSEDPLITGKMASHITRGVQSKKFASQLKHFACNNQELGRWGNDSRVSERALREIYLKGYEIAIKEGNPWSVMSSYNRINGVYGSANYELLTEILRNEWGWDGFVMSDFGTTPKHWEEVIAGGDLKARENSSDPNGLTAALKNGTLQRWQLQRSAERILKFFLRSEVGNDLALKKPVKTSFEEGGNGAFNVNDGNDTTRWSAYNTSDRTNHWIEMDLGDVYNLERISMMPYAYNDRIYQYEVWIKDTVDHEWDSKQEDNKKSFDTLGYRKVTEGNTTTLIKNDIVLDHSVRARYVAIRIPGGSGADGSTLTASIYTVNIFGWKLHTDYIIDEKNKTIHVPPNLSAEELLENVQLSGDNGLMLKIENDNTLTIQDCADNIKDSYTIVVVSKHELSEKINEAANKEQWRYTKESWNVLQNALQNAKFIHQKSNATKEEIDAAVNELKSAISGLETLKRLVSLSPNGGKVSKSSVEVAIGEKVSTAGTLPTPTRKGYIFKGWYTSATGGTLAQDTIVMENITIYAQWMAVTVKFTNKKDAIMNIGKTIKRTAKVLPSEIKVKYKTSNKKIAKVNTNGKVTAKGAGVATITASYGGIHDSYKVFVKPRKVKVTLRSKTKGKVDIGWKKVSGATGYEIQAATNKKGLKKAKPIIIDKTSKLNYAIPKLVGQKLQGGKIYIRMRAYTKVAGYKKPIYGNYCAMKSLNIKK